MNELLPINSYSSSDYPMRQADGQESYHGNQLSTWAGKTT